MSGLRRTMSGHSTRRPRDTQFSSGCPIQAESGHRRILDGLRIGVWVLCPLILSACFGWGSALADEYQEEEKETAETAEMLVQHSLTGDWHGLRHLLLKEGIWSEVVYTSDFMANVSGGLHRDTFYLANVDMLLSVDLEKMAGWRNASLLVYGLGDLGGNPSSAVGDSQIIDNIQAPDTFKLYEAWFQQHFFNRRFSLLAGLYDLNAEFDMLNAAAVFINSSPGTDPTFSQSGRNGPSIFPVTSVAARAKIKFTESFYSQLAVLDGVSGNPNDPHGTHIIFDKDNGLLLTSEVGYLVIPERMVGKLPRFSRPGRRLSQERGQVYTGKYAIGIWGYTAQFPTLLSKATAGPVTTGGGNLGVYVIAEQQLFSESKARDQGLTGYVQLGRADPRFNQFEFYTGGGLVYTGLLPNRDEDILGAMVAVAYNGDTFKQAQRARGIPVGETETEIELTYRAQVSPWLAVQPDFQYVLNPGTNPSIDNAFALGLRLQTTF